MQETQEAQVWSLGGEDPPGGGNGNPFQYSRLENPLDRGVWQATVHGVTKSRTQLSGWVHTHKSHHLSHFKNFMYFDWGWLLYNVVLVSAIQQYESPIGIHTSSPPERPSHLPPLWVVQSRGLSSLCHTANPHWLPILHMVWIRPTLSFPSCVHKSSVCLSTAAHQCHFSRLHIYAPIYDICFSLPDLLHSV